MRGEKEKRRNERREGEKERWREGERKKLSDFLS